MAESSTPSISVESISGSFEGLDSASGVETPDSEPSDPISVNDAAPSVARSRPSRSLSDDPAPSSASSSSAAPPASLSELARAASDPDAQPSIAAPSSRGALPDSAAASSARQPQRMPLSVLVMIISICLLIGFVLAKWRGVELLLPRH
jgi:cobalamin biosynthesis Mg chelatase CobN